MPLLDIKLSKAEISSGKTILDNIIKNTSIFIAADNGVMHLASAALVPCIGFFSVTNKNIYTPYGNGSMALNTNIEDWIISINKILK